MVSKKKSSCEEGIEKCASSDITRLSSIGEPRDAILRSWGRIIRIYHECKGSIENSVPRITDWHHEACRVMTNGDREGRIFLSHPHTNNGFFFLLNTKLESILKNASRKS